jgi:hypothetical protein
VRIPGNARTRCPGIENGLSVTSHDEPVISANELPLDDATQRQRSAAMRAEVLDRGDLALGAAIENDALVADRPSSGLSSISLGVHATYQAFLGYMRSLRG